MGMAGGLHSKASNSRGRSYLLMLLVAFGAALLGVMLVHKFRDIRVCNLLLKTREQQLHSFRHLFQRERDRSKELEKNNEDMKALMYLLRTQKMELDRRLLELQSTIYSLKEKQKIVNVALHHKQSEIKMLREKEIENKNENSQLIGLRQSLKQKEDELEDLRRRLESHGAVNNPSDPHEDNRGEGKSTDFGGQSTSKRDETEARKAEERQKQENLQDKSENVESKLANDHKEAEVKESDAGEHQRADKILQSRVKMETETGKYGRTRKTTRGKRWRYIVNNRAVDNGWRLISKKIKQENNRHLDDRVISTSHREFVKEDNPEEDATKNLTENESKMLKQEELNSKNSDTSSEDANGKQTGNGEVRDGSIKQNPGEEMELTDSKSEEKQEPEREEDSGFNRESDSEVVEDGEEEENKEETEEENKEETEDVTNYE